MRDSKGKFVKGRIPWNKNKKNKPSQGFRKGHPVYKGAEKGWFKKGKNIGKDNIRWNNGKTFKDGYIFIYRPNHPFCNMRGYIKRSRYKMEKHLKRYLTSEEKVHHTNGIKDDDRIKNLKLCFNNSEHQKRYHPCTKKGHQGFYRPS